MHSPCAITFLSGTGHKDLFGVPHIGVMLSPRSTKHVPAGVPIAFDNCCFGDRYVGDEWLLRFLDKQRRADVLFAVAPDVVGDAAATLTRSTPMLGSIRALGFPVAYAAQDGFDAGVVPWELLDVLFIGGTDTFKRGDAGRHAVADGLAHGKRVHMGRINSRTRLLWAAGLGCSSADGSTIRFNTGRYIPEIKRWVSEANQPRLLDVADGRNGA
jgi:hypothetical protein